MTDGVGADQLWSGFALDPRTPAHGDLRASDADRDRIHAVLASAFADGRLDREEFDERSGALLTTRTLGELPALVGDLVAPSSSGATTATGGLDLTAATSADLEARASQEFESQRRGALFAFLGPTLICWAVWVATGFGGGSFQANFPWPLIVMAATGFHAIRTAASRREIVATELRRLEKKQAKALGKRAGDDPDEPTYDRPPNDRPGG